ncbi:MAG: hypothetical protein U1F98_13915 [Verrucomicrobiota bacterium]
MSSHKHADAAPLDLSKWRSLPARLIGAGLVVAAAGAVLSFKHDGGRHFAFSWLVAFMFCLSLCLGSLFLVLVHHLFDAGWSVPIRRFNEHIASLLFPWMAILFIPIAIMAPKLYHWMSPAEQAHPDHALTSKWPLLTIPVFYGVSAAVFVIWWILSHGLRKWSLKQDEVGGAEPTFKMRGYAYWGIVAFAVTLTLAVVMWMQAQTHEWFSTMYPVIYFAGSAWLALATTYVITMILHRQNVLTEVLHEHQYYFIGSLMFAFTVFYAYVHFAQYFIIWNANMPEETFWYVIREKGTWFYVAMVIIFGHFFVPFLGLLRIDVKSFFPYMTAICAWAWLMHFVDLSFNILPVESPTGYPFKWAWLDLGCLALMLGVLSKVFLAKFAASAPFPIKDPRLIEAMGHFHPVPTQISGGELDETDDLRDAPHAGPAR